MSTIVTDPYRRSFLSSDLGQVLLTGAGGTVAYCRDRSTCSAPSTSVVENFLRTVGPREVRTLHDMGVDQGDTIMGAVELVGATSAGLLTGAEKMGARFNYRIDQLQRLLDQYRASRPADRRLLKPKIETLHRDISRQFSQEIGAAARRRSARRAARNPYLAPQRAMNIAAGSRRQIALADNLDIQRLRGLLKGAKVVGGVGTAVAVGMIMRSAYTKAQRGEAWEEEAITGSVEVLGGMAGAAVVTVLFASGPVGWIIVGAGVASVAGTFAGGQFGSWLYNELR